MADNGTRVTRRKLSDYTLDPRNANRGTERGIYMLDRSIEEVGLARSIVAAADGTIPAGNKTLQAAADAGIEDVIEVETDGRALVVVKRTDWETVDVEQARKYAIATALAHQTRSQLTDRSRGATLVAGNILVFGVHGEDADELAKQFDRTPPPPEVAGLRPKLSVCQDAIGHLSRSGHELSLLHI